MGKLQERAVGVGGAILDPCRRGTHELPRASSLFVDFVCCVVIISEVVRERDITTKGTNSTKGRIQM